MENTEEFVKLLRKNLPNEIIESGHYCKWKKEEVRGRLTKVPYSSIGFHAKTSNISHFSSFEEITKNLESYDGIGLGLFPINGKKLGIIDIDHCVTPEGLSEMAEDIVKTLSSYTELSPSKTGIRILFYVDNTYNYNVVSYYIMNQKRGLEIYIEGATKKFCTVTGNRFNDYPLRNATDSLEAVLALYMRRPQKSTPSKKPMVDVFSTNLPDEEVIDRASRAKNGDNFIALYKGELVNKKSASEADAALCEILAFWTGGNRKQIDRIFRTSGLMRDKWDEKRGSRSYGDNTIEFVLSYMTEFYNPNIRKLISDFSDNIFERRVFSLNPYGNFCYTWDDKGAGRFLFDVVHDMVVYVSERESWYYYNGSRWCLDLGNAKIMEYAKSVSDALTHYFHTIKEEVAEGHFEAYAKFIASWGKRGCRGSYIADAQSIAPISITQFDSNKDLLNCANVTINVRTREVHEHTPDDYITKISSVIYNPNARFPRFDMFISEVMCGSVENAKCLQKATGYMVSGDTRLEKLFVFFGEKTRNGKGTFVEALLKVMGDYAISVRPETIATNKMSNSQGPSEDIARLAGIRFASVSEPKRGLLLNESLIKSMTGNDTLNARFLHENSFDFKPQFKMYINTNYLPIITDMTMFKSGRIVVIPFSRHFSEEEQDKGLKDKFATEEAQSAILNWLLDGFELLNKEGLTLPSEVTTATAEYERESDKIKLFKDECLKENPNGEIRTSTLYAEYTAWCRDNGYFIENSRNFNAAIRSFAEIVRKRPRQGGEKTTLLIGYDLIEREFLA